MTNKENAIRRSFLLDEQTLMLNQAMAAGRKLTSAEEQKFAQMSLEINSINSRPTTDIFVPGMATNPSNSKQLSPEYTEAFWNAIKTRNFTNATLAEGGDAQDGSYLVPSQTDPSIAPMAQIECAARRLSNVIVTDMDIKFGYQASKSVAAAKAESTSAGNNAFASNAPTFNSTTLSAYMGGDSVTASWELLQDVKLASQFVSEDLTRAVVAYEENKFVNGSGSGEPLGYLNGCTAANTAALSIDAILDLTGALKQSYYAGASFLANRQTIIALYKNQIANNQYQQFITYDNQGNCRLLGWPVEFSSTMPVYSVSPSTHGAVLFGNFKAGWVLGDRGSSDLRIKVLDQIGALNGLTTILGFRRSDQRCRIQESVMALTVNG